MADTLHETLTEAPVPASLTALRKRCLVTATALSLLMPQLAIAQDDAATEKAREMFQDGVAIETGGDYASALKKFRAVADVKKTPQVLFHIAVCLEQLGKLAEALDNYKQASVLAGKDARYAEVKLTVDNATAALDERVPTLVIQRGKGARSATILLDNVKLEPDATTEPFRLDPGKHVVQARAKGKENFKAELSLAEGARETLRIEMVSLDDEPEEAEGSTRDESSEPPEPKSGRGPMPYVFGAIGVAGLAASGVFYAMRSSANNDLSSQCIELTCPTSAHATWEKARSMNSLTNISAGVGVAALAVSAGMFLFGGSSSGPPKAANVAPRIRLEASTSTPFGAQLAGSFLPRAPRAHRDALPLGHARRRLRL